MTNSAILPLPPAAQFSALPKCPHLAYSVCGYTLLALEGISQYLTADLIDRVTVNGVPHTFRPLGDKALMLLPAIRQEAQTVKVYRKQAGTLEVPKPFKGYVATTTPPEPVYGFTPPFNRYKGTT